ncbi:hypothetical protein QUA27_26670 [Microcoleus sp. Pol14C6]|uniref:hypothetical protein n=1 Tax=unclassified Microcoleus TaxID=2642155 RepID=UPI002FD157E8
MKQNKQQLAIAKKIQKWIQATQEVEKARFAIPITRLTSIKSLCADEVAAEKFAFYIARLVLQQMDLANCPEHFTDEEWQQQKQLVGEALALMDSYRENPSYESRQSLKSLLRDIDGLQGDDYRNFRWTTVRFVCSGDLLKLEYALRCFVEPDFPYWAYKLAREYVEGYGLQSGSGIVAESVPRLLEVAEFWCQYYFDRSLNEKFPDGGDRCVRPNP